MDSNLLKSASGFTKNPLGIIGLLLIIVYGISTFAFSSLELEGWHLSALLVFNISYPLISLFTLCFLVVSHHEKLYSPLDFKNPESFENLIKIKLKKVEETIDKTFEAELRKNLEEMKLSHGFELAILKCSLNCEAGKYDIAEENIDKAMSYRDSPRAFSWKAFICKRKNQLEDAYSFITKAIESATEKPEAVLFYNRACYSCLLGLSDEYILSDLTKAIVLDNTYANKSLDDQDLLSIKSCEKYFALIKNYED